MILLRHFVRWYTLLQTLFGTRTVGANHGSTQGRAESLGIPRMVDETLTKHWTTIVVIPNEAVSAECRCGWVMEGDEDRPIPTQMEQASAAARRHREESIPDLDA